MPIRWWWTCCRCGWRTPLGDEQSATHHRGQHIPVCPGPPIPRTDPEMRVSFYAMEES